MTLAEDLPQRTINKSSILVLQLEQDELAILLIALMHHRIPDETRVYGGLRGEQARVPLKGAHIDAS